MTRTQQNAVYNQRGLTPSLTPGAADKASSITYSAIAEGYLDIQDKNVNLEDIRRDTTQSLNTLEEIFDRKTIEEKQELAGYVSKYGNIAIHKISDHYDWADGSPQKVALHTALGGLTSKLTGNSFSDGAYAAGINEAAINDILDAAGTFKDADGNEYKDPAMAQAISALVGYTTNSIMGLNANTGAYSSQMGSKWNAVLDQIPEFRESIKNDTTINNMELGEGQILGMSVGRKLLGAGESVILFHGNGGNPVFVSDAVLLGVSADYGASFAVGKIWITGPNGGRVIDPVVIAEVMTGFDHGFDYAVLGSYMFWTTSSGYTVHIQSFNTDAHLTYNFSYTTFIGYQNQL